MRAAYDAIYFDLKKSIEDGVYAYRDYLPSESVLVKRYSCAHNTVRKALGILAREGYVQPIHGKGVRVIYRPSVFDLPGYRTYGLGDIEPFCKSGERQGFTTCTKVLQMETIAADAAIAQLTGFDEGQKLVHMERVRYVNGRGVVHETNYFRADIVEGMTKEDAERSVYLYIEEVRNSKLVTCKRRCTVEPATEQDYELLDMGDANCAVLVVCETFDGDGLLCEVTLTRHTPKMFYLEQTAVRTRVSRH